MPGRTRPVKMRKIWSELPKVESIPNLAQNPGLPKPVTIAPALQRALEGFLVQRRADSPKMIEDVVAQVGRNKIQFARQQEKLFLRDFAGNTASLRRMVELPT